MRLVQERSPVLQIVTVFGAFLAGPWAGLQTSLYLVPDSDVIQTASVFAFALVFVGGTLLWTGLGIASAVVLGIWRLIRRRTPAPPLTRDERIVPPGYRAYVVLGAIAGALVGLLAGLITHLSVMTAVVVWTALGLLYGVLLWAAAHHGYLPFFEPE